MIRVVVLAPRARKQLRTVPPFIATKLAAWIEAVEATGLEAVRRVPGFHDEPLKGPRAGQRSIQLSRAYRAIDVIHEGEGQNKVEFVQVEEVHKHDY